MKCQILFFLENEKTTINLSSAELAKRVVKVKDASCYGADTLIRCHSKL